MARAGVTRARAALLLGLLFPFAGSTLVLLASNAGAQVVGPVSPPRHGIVVLFLADGASFEELMSVPVMRALAGPPGGAGLMTTKAGSGDRTRSLYMTLGAGAKVPGDGVEYLMATVLRTNGIELCAPSGSRAASTEVWRLIAPLPVPPCSTVASEDEVVVDVVPGSGGGVPGQLASDGVALERLLSTLPAVRMLVVAGSPVPSADMDRRGDEVTPLVMGTPRRPHLASLVGAPRAVRSDTTRRTGLVSNVDVAPTILHFFGIPIPAEMDGSPVEATTAPAPFALHRLHLEQRRIRLPIQLGEVAYVAGLGIVGIAALIALAVRGSLPGRFAAFLRFATLMAVAEPIPLLAGGLLPHLTYAWAVPFVVITMLVLAALSLTAPSRGPLAPFEFLAAVTLGFVLLDGALGGHAFRVPLLGGTMFDGVRFYGLPNSFIALPLAGATIVAVRLDPFRGFLLLLGVGLFCGFPALGANVGASITLFAAAGVWWVVRTRPRIGIREVAFVAGVVALGLAIVLVANRLAPGAPTHAARFVERTGSSWRGTWSDLRHRLGIGVGQLLDVPPAFIPVVGLAVILVSVLRPPGAVARGLRLAGEPWRQVITVLSLSSLVAFVANDTGVAAAAPGFMYALTALVYPAYLAADDGNDPAGNGHRAVEPSRMGVT